MPLVTQQIEQRTHDNSACAGWICREIELTNLSSLAATLGVPEETIRGWRSGRSSIPFDRFVQVRRRMSDAMFIDALQTLAGPRALIALADNFDLPDHVKPLDVLAKALAALHELTPFIEETQKRVADNVVSPEDVGMIQRLAQKVNAALGETVLIAHRCAGMRAGGSR